MATVPIPNLEWIDTSRYECIDGQLRERPVPGDEHAAMQVVLVDLLRPIVRAMQSKVRPEWSLGAGPKNWLTPDVMVAPNTYQRAENGHLLPPPPPFLVIEVVSPGQGGLPNKAKDYKPYDVPYYWIVDPQTRTCYEVLMNARYITSVMKDDELTAGEIRLAVEDIFAAFDKEMQV